ncbi:MAG TPA: tRNA (guanosine(37)-N1)-methyltransferase TrmD [Pseudomonadales bacterium]|nr:tRNA (guanosine(37)-N1)-methyltransferase TrmD [Pseudomonadales bacterium]
MGRRFLSEENVRIVVVTLFPEMIEAVTRLGVIGRAVKSGILQISCVNPRDFAQDKHRTVDDRPYGGGPGMVMLAEPLSQAIASAKALAQTTDCETDGAVVYLSPQGRKLDQVGVEMLAGRKSLILVAGRYEGIDERVINSSIDEEWSIGDYVLSGGELAALVMVDAVARQLPGVLGHEDSASEDSFANGLLDCPHYTRPEQFNGQNVPEVLLSGNHEAIRKWRLKQALGRTWQRRPDLLEARALSKEEQRLLNEYLQENSLI